MNDDRNILFEDIKTLNRLSTMSLIGILGVIIFGGFSVLLLIGQLWIPAIVPFVLLLISVVILVCRQKNINKTKRESPYKIIETKSSTYEFVTENLRLLSRPENHIVVSEKQAMFRIKDKFNYRILVSSIEEFNKKEYDSMKKSANKKYNSTYKPKQWVSRDVAHKMMRINIICATKMNGELNDYISINSARLLTRVEGILNFVLCDNNLYIPPLFGDVDIAEVERYKKSIRFVLSRCTNETSIQN